jgi:hypothetical protein
MRRCPKRYRHPCDTELRNHAPLSYIILDAVRCGLYAPTHPDSTRQRKTRQRVVERRAERFAKQNQPTWLPTLPTVWEPKPVYGRFWSY